MQSIRDILSTPLGSRLMRRRYGSQLYALIDAPMNSLTIVRCFVAIATALEPRLEDDGNQYGEPRFILKNVAVETAGSDGQIVFYLEGVYVPDGVTRRVDLRMAR
jgi:phage baseplate assembly protein W